MCAGSAHQQTVQERAFLGREAFEDGVLGLNELPLGVGQRRATDGGEIDEVATSVIGVSLAGDAVDPF